MALFGDFQLSIRTGLTIGIAAAVLLTAALIHFPWSMTSRANIADLNARLNAQVIQSIGEKVNGLLVNAVAARQAIATNLAEGVIDIHDELRREFLFLSFLQSQPSLTSIEFAWPDNHAFLVRRVADGVIHMEETMPGEPEAMRRIDTYVMGDDGHLVFLKREMHPSDYRATEQFWYLTAFDRDQPTWSDIYRLPASQTFGVTTTQAIKHSGALLGVIGVSIALDRLSDFLDGIDISQGSAVCLTNTYSELVAVQKRLYQAGESTEQSTDMVKLDDERFAAGRVVVAALNAHGATLRSIQRTSQFTFYDSVTAETYFVTLAPLAHMGLVVSVVIPSTDVLGDIQRNTRRLVLALAGFMVIIVALATLTARGMIGVPLARVTENLQQIEDFRFERIRAIPSRFSEIRQVSVATIRMRSSLASFQKYIPTALVRTLFAQGMEAELGGEHRELTIFFMDIANFTGIAERLGDNLIAFLGDYLSEMSIQVQAHEGTIDKYIGDGIMAFWGAPVASPQHALQACRAALVCQARLAALRANLRAQGLPEIHARVGLNTGSVLVGNFGSRDRLNYTVIGDPVNVASRLESLNKVYGTEIIIGQGTYEAACDHILVRRLDRVAVYGKEMGLDMFELLGMRDEVQSTMLEWIAVYEQGCTALRVRDWDGAMTLFRQVIAMRGGHDSVSSVQIARAQAFKSNPPPPTWDGLVVMEYK
ncbi:MAG: adenylate/guanylate cyclase domain-containing protein [Candidatus Tectimicrobiota bacterium]